MAILKIYKNNWQATIRICLLIIFAGNIISCKKFLEVELNQAEVTSEQVFNDERNANAAAVGLFKKMMKSTFAGGGANGVPSLTGLSSDELHNVLQDLSFVPFEDNSLLANNEKVFGLWSTGYQIIYEANAIIENLDKYYKGSDSVKRTIQGEALFARAYCYFYLVNLFGGVPIITTTDYQANAVLSRSSIEEVYEQILKDLIEAKSLLPETYAGNERVRPNKMAASALLARVYIYRGDWENAELNASEVIESGNYSILTDLTEVFKKASNEVIWQLSSDPPFNTTEAVDFVVLYGPGSSTVTLTNKLLGSFENNDSRLNNWVGAYDDGSINIKFPYKYKVADYGAPISEHYVVLRLAEQFLIRAEARAMQENYTGAIEDINMIKERAGTDILQDAAELHDLEVMVDIIMKERFLELFAEGGHRWFDLKRTGKLQEELESIKPQWQSTDALYPIPQQEREKNPNLGSQNEGY